MKHNQTLHVLGCVPILLNMLLELADEAEHFHTFKIMKNMPIDINEEFVPFPHWQIEVLNCYEDTYRAILDEYYALSVVGVKSKPIVFNYFRELIQLEPHHLINLIHPTAYISPSVKTNYGLQVESLTTIAACVSLGFAINIKRNCNIGHHCQLGDYVTINPGVTLSSFVQVGAHTMIGSGTSVKDNITIGENSIIGVGSVVVKDIPPDSVAFGNPCKVHRIND